MMKGNGNGLCRDVYTGVLERGLSWNKLDDRVLCLFEREREREREL